MIGASNRIMAAYREPCVLLQAGPLLPGEVPPVASR